MKLIFMGSPESDTYAAREEKPQHEVTISKDFLLGKYVVTQEQYQQIMGKNPSTYKGANFPVAACFPETPFVEAARDDEPDLPGARTISPRYLLRIAWPCRDSRAMNVPVGLEPFAARAALLASSSVSL